MGYVVVIWGYTIPIAENQIDKKMEHEMDEGFM